MNKSALTQPILRDNPIMVQVLGLCSALAVTQSLLPALIMSISVITVLGFSSFVISLLRQVMPHSIRLILEMTIIASMVIIVDEVIKTVAPEVSRMLSVFVGLIITNCIVLGRAESYALHKPPAQSVLDALGNGLGYALILCTVAAVRELLAQGTVLQYPVLVTTAKGGEYHANEFMLLPASAFFIIGVLVWIIRAVARRNMTGAGESRDG